MNNGFIQCFILFLHMGRPLLISRGDTDYIYDTYDRHATKLIISNKLDRPFKHHIYNTPIIFRVTLHQ